MAIVESDFFVGSSNRTSSSGWVQLPSSLSLCISVSSSLPILLFDFREAWMMGLRCWVRDAPRTSSMPSTFRLSRALGISHASSNVNSL
ncbi:hypothetical protein KC331_g33 [Hortaea werneckii]|nr:hypothetical protein KC331_g33 [Hortaea werneckii]